MAPKPPRNPMAMANIVVTVYSLSLNDVIACDTAVQIENRFDICVVALQFSYSTVTLFARFLG